jgi:hypothetical protein
MLWHLHQTDYDQSTPVFAVFIPQTAIFQSQPIPYATEATKGRAEPANNKRLCLGVAPPYIVAQTVASVMPTPQMIRGDQTYRLRNKPPKKGEVDFQYHPHSQTVAAPTANGKL